MAVNVEDVAQRQEVPVRARLVVARALESISTDRCTVETRRVLRVVVGNPPAASGLDVSVRGCCTEAIQRALRRITEVTVSEVQPGTPWPDGVVDEATGSDLRADFEDFKIAVGQTAMKYARANGLCSVVETALQEMGIEPPNRQQLRLTLTLPSNLGFERNGQPFNFATLDNNYQSARRYTEMLRQIGITANAAAFITNREYVDFEVDDEDEDDE